MMLRAPLRALLPALMLFSLPAIAEPVTVEVTADRNADRLRLLIEHTRSVGYRFEQVGGRLELTYDQPVAIDMPATLDETLVADVEIGAKSVSLVTGEAFIDYDLFELRNPLRIIIDLRGRGGAVVVPTPHRRLAGERVVVIDPGHGGIEEGAVGPGGLVEKDVALDLARRLAARLESRSGVTAVLTRSDDRLVGHDERTAIANHNRADLFLSIHLNGSHRRSARGAETYFLSEDATDDEARTLAALENRGAVADDPGAVEGLDLVLWDLAQNRYLAESSGLAERIQSELNRLTGTRNRGVRQAPFRVLRGATMPAVLVEVGFVSNPEEESKLARDDYRDRIVEALANAVRAYLGELRRIDAPDSSVGGFTP